MAHWTPLKADVLDSLAEEFLHNYGTGRTLLAVDGIDGAGKTQFADALADALRAKGHTVFRASVDGVTGDRLRQYLVDPFRRGESFVTALSASEAPPVIARPDASVIVDGGGLEMWGLWNWSIWLDEPGADGQRDLLAESARRTRASAIVDNSDWDHPRRVFADSC